MSLPTIDETYIALREHITKAQECSAMLAHLYNADPTRNDTIRAKGWLAISEGMRLMNHKIVEMMTGRLN